MLDDVLDLLDRRSAFLDSLIRDFDDFLGKIFGAIVLKLPGGESGLGDGFGDFVLVEVDNLAVSFDDFFEHKNIPP